MLKPVPAQPAANDNAAPQPHPRGVPIIGFVGEAGEVTITDPTWRADPRPSSPAILANSPREA